MNDERRAARLSSAQRYADAVREAVTNGAPMMDLDEIAAREDLADIGRRGYVTGRRIA